ncbi:acyltransferase family protein [Chryseobacterium sp. RU33C]|uniref:acyltransferase family protein n=1 Tax=Chryseobacterium sp. RU33C TaxID=1907398 RepID=UPI0009542DAC|nr:acyltransferase family protein [Chryseobacterium sp. RU33C]SIR22359.1 Peptidoglycan/LPS O-acetylase OafA/YrhL, contains acyltransferase and SGNH-hydrolase domains [Chryseobacterium sp. RU33C]
MHFRSDIQGLRAVAFLLVFIFHLNSGWLPGGFLGVDVFFVISGYLMTSIILHQKEKKTFSFIDFYSKRLKRIVPVYFFVLLCISLVGSYIYMSVDINTLKQSILKSAIFISNNHFSAGNSYFGAKMVENPLLHTWSLSVEMQFYFFLPLLLIFINKKYLPAVILGLIIFLSLYTTYKLIFWNSKGHTYFSLSARIPEFLVGSFFSISLGNLDLIKRKKQNIIAVFCVVVLSVCSFVINENSNFPGILALVPCIAAAGLLSLKNNMVSDFLGQRIPVYIGELSYSLYLWHWPVMAFIRYKFDTYDFSVTQIFIVCVATFILSYLSYTFIETKLRVAKSKLFYKIFLPATAVLLLYTYFLPVITKVNAIPEYYSKAFFGIKSHYDGQVEKFGDISKNDSILLIGDSHALMLKPFLNYLGKKHHFSYNTITCDGYPAVEGINESEIPEKDLFFYENSRKLANATTENIKKNKVIIINSIGYTRVPSLKSSLEKMVANLNGDQKIIFIKSFPKLDHSPLRINNSFIRKNKFEYDILYNKSDNLFLNDLSKKYKNVYVYDVSKSRIFETAPYINDTVFYYDKEHINTLGSIKLAKDLDQSFMNFFNPQIKK